MHSVIKGNCYKKFKKYIEFLRQKSPLFKINLERETSNENLEKKFFKKKIKNGIAVLHLIFSAL